jgi:NodT family efflux transporter outer membrane factor (OMF) lipoprotein
MARKTMPRKTTAPVRTALKTTALACLTLLAGCTVGPKYVRPSVAVPTAYKEMDTSFWKISQPRDGEARGEWWAGFTDPQLNALEQSLNKSNQNIAAAAAAVDAARAIVRESRSQYFPTVTGGAAITNSRLSTFGPKPAGVVYSEFSLPVQASWEPDLWGRVRNTVKANSFAAQGSAADLENVRLAAQAELAVDYYELRAQDDLKRVLDATVSAYREALDLTRNRSDAGLDADEAVAQAEFQWEAAQAQDTNLGNLRAQYEHAIAVLTGQPAGSFSIVFSTSLEGPGVSLPAIPIGVPSELLERRPDIAAAERAVAQANAQIGVAKAAFYPNVTLSAAGGLENLSMAQWLTWPSRVWSVGPSLAETLFDGGLRRATVQQSQAAYDQTVANYRQTVLTAFQQVEDNLAAVRILSEVIGQQDAAIRSAARSLAEADARYRSGIDPYLNVIFAQTGLLAAQQTAVTFREQQMVAAVQLIKALGGGWDTERLAWPKELGKPTGGKTAGAASF